MATNCQGIIMMYLIYLEKELLNLMRQFNP